MYLLFNKGAKYFYKLNFALQSKLGILLMLMENKQENFKNKTFISNYKIPLLSS